MDKSNKPDSDITLNSDGTASFYLAYESDLLGTVTGPFVFKCLLTPIEQLSVGREYRQLIGQYPEESTETEKYLGFCLSALKYRILKAPPFWTSTPEYPGNLNDPQVISIILDRAIQSELLYKENLKKKKEEALKKSEKAIEKIKEDLKNTK